MAKKTSVAFSQMYLAKALEGEVQAWVDQGWPGVTKITLELFNYWFNRDESTEERFYDCQRRAIETIVYCHEILQVRTLKDLFERVAPETLNEHLPLKFDIIWELAREARKYKPDQKKEAAEDLSTACPIALDATNTKQMTTLH